MRGITILTKTIELNLVAEEAKIWKEWERIKSEGIVKLLIK